LYHASASSRSILSQLSTTFVMTHLVLLVKDTASRNVLIAFDTTLERPSRWAPHTHQAA
jgi:hypothetical protein